MPLVHRDPYSPVPGRIMSVYDDKPNGKLDLSEFAQVIHDLSAADEAPAAPVPKKTKAHMRVVARSKRTASHRRKATS